MRLVTGEGFNDDLHKVSDLGRSIQSEMIGDGICELSSKSCHGNAMIRLMRHRGDAIQIPASIQQIPTAVGQGIARLKWRNLR